MTAKATRPLRAITLIQPWATAFTQLGKRLENRGWAPTPDTLVPGEWLALHAGLKFDVGSLDQLQAEFGNRLRPPFTQSAIMGLVRYERACRSLGEVPAAQRIWWGNQKAGLLFQDDMVVLPVPIPCSGDRGLWLVPVDIATRLRAAWRAWRDAR